MRYFAELSYLGTRYSGWQSQPEGQGLGIQQVVSEALGTIMRCNMTVTGAGRTDAGVHAEKIFAHFDTGMPIEDPGNLCRRLNSLLPADIAVKRIFPVRDDAHARFSAVMREYKYRINTSKDPFRTDTSYYFYHKLDAAPMNRACAILMEYEDFQCFSKVHTDVKTFICHIEYARWDENPDGSLVFTIAADRFLRNMVRAIVGTMLDIGMGKMPPEKIRDIIESKDRCRSGMSAEARGLTLTDVKYIWEDILP